MKNYYDELEVSRNASPEVINKAYKVLAKKYHPDTTKENKEIAEERFKKISQAYEILSNENKKRAYDEEFNRINPQISNEEYKRLLKNNEVLQAELATLKNKLNSFNTTNVNSIKYNANQNNNTKQTSYSSRPKQTSPTNKTNKVNNQYSFIDLIRFKLNNLLKNIFAILLTIIFIFLIISILLHIPYTRNLLLNDMGFNILFHLFN